MKYEIKGFGTYSCYEKIWFQVEADTEEEAMALVKEDPSQYQTDSKSIDVYDSEYQDLDQWTIVK